MKNTFSRNTLMLICLSACAFVVSAQTNCTPNPPTGNPGVFPAPDDIPCIERNVPYDFTMQLENFTTFNSPLGVITVDWTRIDRIENFPCGILWQSDKSQYAPGEAGCIRVYGTSNELVGQYPLRIYMTMQMQAPGLGTLTVSDELQNLVSMAGLANDYRYVSRVIETGDACPPRDIYSTSVASCHLASVTPGSAPMGSSVNLTITGTGTHFSQGTVTVWFEQGGTAVYPDSSPSVINDTAISASFTFNGPCGFYNLNVQNTVDGLLTLSNAIEVRCDDGDPCTLDYCDGIAGCVFYPACDDGNPCTIDSCDALGNCFNTPAVCDDGVACTYDYCGSWSGCASNPACNDNDTCTIDSCDGLGNCFFTPVVCDDGDACTYDHCDYYGCLSDLPCGDNDPCTIDSCDGQGNCLNTPFVCDDGDPCTDDYCADFSSGFCYTSPRCDDGDPCTIDSCDGLGNCFNTPVICDDGDGCTTDYCDYWYGCYNYLVCGDYNSCTIDSCDGQGNCFYLPYVCDDGDLCTNDYCDGIGSCSTSPYCDDYSPCTSDSCDGQGNCINTPVVCDDGVFCTNDFCDYWNGCASYPSCDDYNACTIDSCDGQGNCINTAVVCDDGDACTTDLCDYWSGGCYSYPACNDYNICTIDSCDGQGNCINTAVVCDDGDACTIDYYCDYWYGCISSFVCDDGDPCTIDSCDGFGNCFYTPVVCDDGVFCTYDVCDYWYGWCISSFVCDDGDPCTIDSCDGLGNCLYTPFVCDDGDLCTDDYCDGMGGCSVYPHCDDGDPCTTDSCSGTSICYFQQMSCDDRNPCTVDYCDGAGGCYTSPHCYDYDACTTDSCDGHLNCFFTPLVCDDGDPCTDDYCDYWYGGCISNPHCPPANDNVCAAEALQLGTPAPFDNRMATVEPGEATPGSGTGVDACNSQDGWCSSDIDVQNSVWFYFTAPASGHVKVSSEAIDAQLAVYTAGDCNDFSTFSKVGANDDGNPACEFCPLAELSCLTPGLIYYVQLDGYVGANGTGAITATDAGPADINITYTLVNASTDLDIGPLREGDILNKRLLPPFNIRADVDACGVPAGSVKFVLNGSTVRIENIAPLAIAGDAPTGNYKTWNVSQGSYHLQTSAYRNRNMNGGLLGLPGEINFTVVDDDCYPLTVEINTDLYGEQTSFKLTDLTDNTLVGSTDSGSLGSATNYRQSFCVPADHCYEFRIFDSDGICCLYGNGSYAVTFNSSVVASGGEFVSSETTAFGNCQPDCEGVIGGTAVTDVNGACCQPDDLDCSGVCFGGDNTLQVVSFTLVETKTDADIRPLNDGDVIDLSATPFISVRANLCASAGSVRFRVNGSNFSLENIAPYAIAGDAPPGNYKKWNVSPGTYTIEAIPYPGAGGSGTAGVSKTITITVVGGSSKTGDENTAVNITGEDGLAIRAYPNPFNDMLTFEFSIPKEGAVALELYSISGEKIATVFEGKVAGGEINRHVFHAGDLASGLYMYKIKTNEAVVTERVMLAR